MRKRTVDCRNIETPEALQIYLQYCLDFPAWYGRNLDALYDLITESSSEALELTLITGSSGAEMQTYLERLRRVLRDAAEESGGGFQFAEKIEK